MEVPLQSLLSIPVHLWIKGFKVMNIYVCALFTEKLTKEKAGKRKLHQHVFINGLESDKIKMAKKKKQQQKNKNKNKTKQQQQLNKRAENCVIFINRFHMHFLIFLVVPSQQ